MNQITEGIKGFYSLLDSEEKVEVIRNVVLNMPPGMKLRDLFSEDEVNRIGRFDIDLVPGQVGEIALLEGKCEVKRDFKVSETGNVAVELECRGRPSGISITDAPVWYFWLTGREYQDEVAVAVTVERLRGLAELGRYVRGGDDDASFMSLVKVGDLVRPSSWIEERLRQYIRDLASREVDPKEFTECVLRWIWEIQPDVEQSGHILDSCNLKALVHICSRIREHNKVRL